MKANFKPVASLVSDVRLRVVDRVEAGDEGSPALTGVGGVVMRGAIAHPEEWRPWFNEDKSKFRFLHNAHRFTLYRRSVSPYWYVKFRHAGRQWPMSLETTDWKTGRSRAVSEYERMKSPLWKIEEELKPAAPKPFVSLGALFKCYEERIRIKKELDPKTVTGNIRKLRILVREGMGMAKETPDEKVDSLLTSVLTRALVRTFQDERRRAVLNADDVVRGRANLTMDSLLAQARSLFTGEAMECYHEAKLHLPDLTEFKGVKKRKGYHAVRYQPIPDETIGEMEKGILELRESRPSVYLGYKLMLRLGMRNSEAIAATPAWIEKGSGVVMESPGRADGKALPAVPVLKEMYFMAIICRPDFTPKNKLDRRVPIPPDVLADVRFVLGLKDGEKLSAAKPEYLIQGATQTDREDVIDRELNNWVTQFIPDRIKKSYELRKHFGAIVANTQGIYKAQEYLGHASVTTTEKHYSHWLKTRNSRPMLLEDLLPTVLKVEAGETKGTETTEGT